MATWMHYARLLGCYCGSSQGSIDSMKVSVSLPEDDVRYLDSYARSRGIDSRSAVLHKAVGLLRATELEDSYAAAWSSWDSSGDAEMWDSVTGDGLGG